MSGGEIRKYIEANRESNLSKNDIPSRTVTTFNEDMIPIVITINGVAIEMWVNEENKIKLESQGSYKS